MPVHDYEVPDFSAHDPFVSIYRYKSRSIVEGGQKSLDRVKVHEVRHII